VPQLLAELAAITSRPWTLMEVCGGQTHAILRWGLDQLLQPGLRLIHGPGCPVCITPAAILDAAIALAARPELILASYGDMLRVPGSDGTSLLEARAAGGDVRLLTSPLQALTLARDHPDRQVVFLAVGFETTAPATALLAHQTLALGLTNLTILCAHSRVAPAMEALLAPPPGDGGEEEVPGADPPSPVQAFLAAGHVCAVLGTEELEALVARRRLPVVVSGFGPEELLRGVLACVRQLEAGQARLANAYAAVVRPAGNAAARRLLTEVFEPVDRPWRGLGLIPGGGLALAGPFAALEARVRFGLSEAIDAAEPGLRHTGSGPHPWSHPRRQAEPSGSPPPDGAAEAWPPTTAGPEAAGSEAAGSTAGFTAAGNPAGGARRLWHPRAGRPEAGPPAAAAPRSGHSETGHSETGGSETWPPAAAPPEAAPPQTAGPQSWPTATATACIAGAILRGLALPSHCPSFGAACTPEHPLGAPMVSSEGACAAYHHYRSGPAP
jgi:hydrogenase expression/formation protein HypD